MFYIGVKQKSAQNNLSQTVHQGALLHRIVMPESNVFGQIHLGNYG